MIYQKRRKYKYTLLEKQSYRTGIKSEGCDTDYLTMTPDGLLTVKRQYSWDGPSGPTRDTKTFMRGSLIHDALYQLIRARALPVKARPAADKILQKICLADGMSRVRAWYVYSCVRMGGGSSVEPNFLVAP